jgi:hypothetical protein
MSSIDFNIAETFLKRLQTSVFMKIDKKHKQNMDCNTLFLKVKHGEDNYHAIKEFNSITNEITVRTPGYDEALFFENLVKLDGNSICKYDVSPRFVSYYYDECDFCFVLFSKTTPDSLRMRTKSSYAVCSLLFLKVLKNPTPPNDLYISLVCAEQKSQSEKSSMGSRLILLAEDFAKQGKLGKIVLSSLDKPLGFYSSKGFAPVSGRDLFEVPEDVRLSIFKRDGSLLHPDLPKHALFVNSHGMTTSFNNATRLLPRNTNHQELLSGLSMDSLRRSERTTKGKKFLGDKSKIGMLKGVKVQEDMLIMEKVITPSSPEAGSKKAMGIVKRRKSRRRRSRRPRSRRPISRSPRSRSPRSKRPRSKSKKSTKK